MTGRSFYRDIHIRTCLLKCTFFQNLEICDKIEMGLGWVGRSMGRGHLLSEIQKWVLVKLFKSELGFYIPV